MDSCFLIRRVGWLLPALILLQPTALRARLVIIGSAAVLLAATSATPITFAHQGTRMLFSTAETPGSVRVWKKFGAAVRAAPSSDAPNLGIASCGAVFDVLGSAAGWYRVRSTGHTSEAASVLEGWIGSTRVVPASDPPAACDGPNPVYAVGEQLIAGATSSGCLSIRPDAAPDAPVLTCLHQGDTVTILDGPRTGGEFDWFQVRWGSTVGWTRADFLLRSPSPAVGSLDVALLAPVPKGVVITEATLGCRAPQGFACNGPSGGSLYLHPDDTWWNSPARPILAPAPGIVAGVDDVSDPLTPGTTTSDLELRLDDGANLLIEGLDQASVRRQLVGTRIPRGTLLGRGGAREIRLFLHAVDETGQSGACTAPGASGPFCTLTFESPHTFEGRAIPYDPQGGLKRFAAGSGAFPLTSTNSQTGEGGNCPLANVLPVNVVIVGGGPWVTDPTSQPRDTIDVAAAPIRGDGTDLIVSCDPTGNGYRIESPSLWGSAAVGWDKRAAQQWLLEHGASADTPIDFRARCRSRPDQTVPETEPDQSCFLV